MGREGGEMWAGPGQGEGNPGITSAYLQRRSQGAQTGRRRGYLLSCPGPAGQQHTVLSFRLLLLPPPHSRNSPAQPPPVRSPLLLPVAPWRPLCAFSGIWFQQRTWEKSGGEAKTCWVGAAGFPASERSRQGDLTLTA